MSETVSRFRMQTERTRRRFGSRALCLAALVPTMAGVATGQAEDWSYRSFELPLAVARAPEGAGVDPTLEMVLDDGVADGAFGVGGATSRPFLWFTVFDAPAFYLDLQEIWVLFPEDPEITPGDAVELVVYRDTDGDPTNGALLLATFDEVVQAADGATFSVYPLPTPVEFRNGGQILLGVVSRFAAGGGVPLTLPAALDTTTVSGRSWVATWQGDPPTPPQLPPDQSLFRIDDLVPGTWMIRGFGTEGVVAPRSIPELGRRGVLVMTLLLAAAGLWLLRAR